MAIPNRLVPTLLLCLGVGGNAQDWTPPGNAALVAPKRGADPVLACTPAQLARLRAALRRDEPAVLGVVAAVRAALPRPVVFPPRGGQHNQWYQCDACQRALVTVDAGHHRCPGCQKVYSGPPYDDVVMSRVHSDNLARARQAAWAFALTGERGFAADTRTILLGYADRYRSYPYHSNAKDASAPRDSGGHIKEQTLSEASLLVRDVAPALDLIWPTLDDDARQHVLADLIRPMVDNIAKCRRGKSNWQSWHNAAMFSAGVLLGDDTLLRRSVLDERHGLLFQMRVSVSADGMWYENSFGYHIYTLAALTAHADAARTVGIDLFGHPSLRAMCALPARYVMADGRLPRLGDDVDSAPERAADSLEAAFAATGDSRLAAVLPRGAATWESLRHGRDMNTPQHRDALRSDLLQASGHAILRRDAGRSSALLTFAPFGGFHDHFDKLSFVWYAHGQERGVDPGRAKSQAYRLPIHTDWYRATIAHNTVVVDGNSQREAGGELLAFVDGDDFAAAAARTTKAWNDVEHRRCVILGDTWLLVVDRLIGTTEHTFDWLYHDRGTQVDCATTTSTPAPLGVRGEQFVRWTGAGETAGAPTATFLAANARTTLTMAEDGPTHVRTGTGPVQSVDDRAPFILVRRTGDEATFACLLAAAAPGEPAPTARIASRRDGNGLVVTARVGDTAHTFAWDLGGNVQRR